MKKILLTAAMLLACSGRAYLYRRSTRNGLRSTKSLGPRSPETDQILAHFQRQKAEAQTRLAALADKIDQLEERLNKIAPLLERLTEAQEEYKAAKE